MTAIDPRNCDNPEHQKVQGRYGEYCPTCWKAKKIEEGTWRGPATRATEMQDDGLSVDAGPLTRTEVHALIEHHHAAAKVRIDLATAAPEKVARTLAGIESHLNRAQALRECLIEDEDLGEPPRYIPVVTDVWEAPPAFPEPLPPEAMVQPPEPVPSFTPQPPAPAVTTCKRSGCGNIALDEDGFCFEHDRGFTNPPPPIIDESTLAE